MASGRHLKSQKITYKQRFDTVMHSEPLEPKIMWKLLLLTQLTLSCHTPLTSVTLLVGLPASAMAPMGPYSLVCNYMAYFWPQSTIPHHSSSTSTPFDTS